MKNFYLYFLLMLICFPGWVNAQRITVSENKFVVDAKEIFMNGANTPWHNWNDFGGNYQSAWWNDEFKRIKDAGGNSTRIWISCSGQVGLIIAEDGTVSGATDAFWDNLDDMFQSAANNKIYIKATLISFDHFKNSYSTYTKWRNMINSNEMVSSFVDNYVVPFVKRYNDNPYLWAIDVCNEIEWVNQDAACGNIPWNRLQYLVARVAAAVHENSQVLVTLGSAAVKWNSAKGEGNYWSDANLKARYNNDKARLDFYSPHFYGWVVQWFGNFAKDKTPAYYGIDDRPCVVGENPAKGVYDDGATPSLVVPASQMFLAAYKNGWDGLMPWTSNGVDDNGSLDDFSSGLLAFQHAHPSLVDPSLPDGIHQYANSEKNIISNILLNSDNKQQIIVQLSNSEKVLLQMTDLQGHIIYSHQVSQKEITIQTGTFPKGIYLLSALKNGHKESRKISLY
jgi:hypothetical protein